MADREAAILTRPITGIENRTPLEVFDIMCDRIKFHGFDAARPEWVRIRSVEDLPKESGEYIWRHKDGHIWHGFFIPSEPRALAEMNVAYMPIPPFEEESE